MQKQLLKFRKAFTNIAVAPFLLISNNSEIAAKYLPSNVEESITLVDINYIDNGYFQGLDNLPEKNFLIAENQKKINQESVLISEIIIEGLENHPEGIGCI